MTLLFFFWFPAVLSTAGLIFCLVQAWRKRSSGLLLLAAVFALHLIRAAAQMSAIHSFVPQQTGPNTWTAPVITVDGMTTPLETLLFLAAVLLASRLANPLGKKELPS